MGYTAFTNDYTSPDPNVLARIYQRQANNRLRVANKMQDGNTVLGQLTTECCSDPAYGGQGYYDDPSYSSAATSAAIASLIPGTPASTAAVPTSGVSPAAVPTPSSPGSGIPSVPLTPNDILSNTRGFPLRANGGPWPRAKISNRYAASRAAAYPDYGATPTARMLVPDCPCFGSGPPVVMAIPQITAPITASPNPTPPASKCPYPGCSTGNVCLDLITGCVSNSQVTQAQVEACTQAGYSTFGNSGAWLSAILLGCGTNLPYLGMPLPNPPTATGSMQNQLAAADAAGAGASSAARGMGGLGQDDSSQLGGFLAIVAVAGILVWASKKW